MKQTTLCYLERGGQYLMLHRVKKQNDASHDKWIGVGGKCEADESPDECMLREVKEETGLCVIPDSIREFGNVLRLQKGNEGSHIIFVQENYYYLCEVEKGIGEQNLDPYELEAGFELRYVTMEEAIQENAAFHSDDLFEQLMIDRDRKVLELLVRSGR